jgi:hypothetical protein
LRPERPVKRLLGLDPDGDDIAALDRHSAVEDRAGAVVVADREAQLQLRHQ